jgi:RNA polymerase sigma-70 factor (ECF subfamily)
LEILAPLPATSAEANANGVESQSPGGREQSERTLGNREPSERLRRRRWINNSPDYPEVTPLNLAIAESTQSPDYFAAVVEAHWTTVYRLMFSMTGNAHDCEDLTQETFLRALRRWDSFKQGTNLRKWLLRIAANAFFDVKRKQQRLKITPLQIEVSCKAAPAELTLELQEQESLARSALEKLTDLTRLVFNLRVTEDLAFREIAELAGISEAAARWHMHRARFKLLKSLDRY